MATSEGGLTKSNGFCSSCGTALVAESRFCAGCGTALGAGPIEENPASVQEDAGMGLMTAWGCFAGALLTLVLTSKLSGELGFFVYIAIGIAMSRVVMRRLVQWHPTYDTLYNVTSAKLWMAVLWPLQMGSLLFRLTVNKVL